MSGDSAHRIQHALIMDAAIEQLLLNHTLALFGKLVFRGHLLGCPALAGKG